MGGIEDYISAGIPKLKNTVVTKWELLIYLYSSFWFQFQFIYYLFV